MTIKVGLTGSIGMGKSTTAQIFSRKGCDLWDADAAVHRLYAKNGAAVKDIEAIFPEAVINDEVSRPALRRVIQKDPKNLKILESIVHPLVAKDRVRFSESTNAKIVVFDIPLLFETRADKYMDVTVCVSVSGEEQKKRVMSRRTFSETEFQVVLKNQMPDDEKRGLSDYVVITDTPEHAEEQVEAILRELNRRFSNA